MLIILLPSPEANVIGWEEQLGEREGRFILCPDSSVIYRNSADARDWFAGANVAQFRAAAEAWNEYTETVARTPEPKQDEIVQRLRSALAEVGVLAGSPDSSFWDVLLEQADHGLL